MNKFHDELLLERNNYNDLKCKYDKLKTDYDDLKKWKDSHYCNSDINIEDIKLNINKDVKDEYEKNIKKLNITILKLQEDINILNMNKIDKIENPIDNNILFKSLKDKNKKLDEKLNDLVNSNKIDKQSIIDEITFSLESKFSIEKQEIRNEYNGIINESDKKINNLKKQLNQNIKKIDKNIKNKNDKYSDDNLLNSIVFYNNINSNWKNLVSCFTYNKIFQLYKLDIFINEDKKVNKDNYKEVYEYLNIYELDPDKIKKTII
jgi:vacuolar-type H+-ATPase subunit I/STV1